MAKPSGSAGTRTTRTEVIDIKTLAATLETDPRTLRAFLRGLDRGVGRGSTYRWSSPSDAAVVAIVAAWREQPASEPTATEDA